jgi:hypothetical protein
MNSQVVSLVLTLVLLGLVVFGFWWAIKSVGSVTDLPKKAFESNAKSHLAAASEVNKDFASVKDPKLSKKQKTKNVGKGVGKSAWEIGRYAFGLPGL